MDSRYQILGKLYNINPKGRVPSGAAGLDEMLGGGIPLGHIVVVIGSAGTGKTTLALQYIYDGLCKGESAIYISTEEERDSIISTAASYGWNLGEYIEKEKLKLLNLELPDIKTTARRVKTDFPELIKSFKASRLVIDSITHFSMVFDDHIERRIRLIDLNKTIKKAGTTALYTSEMDMNNPVCSKDGIIEYSTDGILFLQQREIANNIKLIMQVRKMRRTVHERRYRSYEITGSGIVVNPMDLQRDEDRKNIYEDDKKISHMS